VCLRGCVGSSSVGNARRLPAFAASYDCVHQYKHCYSYLQRVRNRDPVVLVARTLGAATARVPNSVNMWHMHTVQSVFTICWAIVPNLLNNKFQNILLSSF
jgi:hypothetical protein